MPNKEFALKYNLTTGTAETVGKNVVAEIYLSPQLLYRSNEAIKATIAHEVIHIANLHYLQRIFFYKYDLAIKQLNNDQYKKCEKILHTIHEHQADILPLADPEYAQAQKNILLRL